MKKVVLFISLFMVLSFAGQASVHCSVTFSGQSFEKLVDQYDRDEIASAEFYSSFDYLNLKPENAKYINSKILLTDRYGDPEVDYKHSLVKIENILVDYTHRKNWYRVSAEKHSNGYLAQLIFQALNIHLINNNRNEIEFKDALELLDQNLGIEAFSSYRKDINSLSSDSRTQLLLTAYGLSNSLREVNPVKSLELSKELFLRRNIRKTTLVLGYIKDISMLSKNESPVYLNRLKRLLKSKTWNEKNIDELSRKVYRLLFKTVVKEMKEFGIGVDTTKFRGLDAQFDIESFIVTYARMKSTPKLRRHASTVLLALKYQLEGRFEEYKFEGILKDDIKTSRKQLSGLSKKQVEVWKRDRVVLKKISIELEQDREQFYELRSEIVERVLRPIKKLYFEQSSVFGSPEVFVYREKKPKELVHQLASNIVGPKANIHGIKKPQELLEYLISEYPGLNISRALMELSTFVTRETHFSPYQKKSIWRFVRNVHKQLDLSESEIAIVNSALDIMREIKPSFEKGTFITAVKLKSSRGLLSLAAEAGCTGTCLNYKTGAQGHSALGWAVDANVQGVIGFVLSRKSFKNQHEFEQFVSWQEANKLEMEYDSLKKMMLFHNVESGKTISSILLNSAPNRMLIHYGKNGESKPAIVEAEMSSQFTQQHVELSALMRTLVADMASEMGVLTGGRISKPKSKSSAGIFVSHPYGVFDGPHDVIQEGH